MKSYDFYKDGWTDYWYVDIPNWAGEKADLQMVEGADTMLELMSQGDRRFRVSFSTQKEMGFDKLEFVRETPEYEEGALYNLKTFCGIDYELSVWLCNVTKWVFGNFPNEIYVKRN